MHILKWGIAAFVPLIVAGLVAAQPPKSKAMPEGWFGELMGWSKPKPKPKPKDDAKPGDKQTASQPSAQDKVLAHERIMNAYLRRQAVCLRLLEIAQTSNNSTLENEALELDTLAMELYRQQAQKLGISVRAPQPDEMEPEPEDASPTLPSLPRNGPLPTRFRSGGLGVGIREDMR